MIFDEPTTALDVTTQVEVLRAFREAVRERHTTAVYVSHDLAVVAQIADRIIVLRDGAMRETGPTSRILSEPADSYTKSLLAAAAPRPQQSQQQPSAAAPLLEVHGLTAGYGRIDRQGRLPIPVLRDISLEIRAGSARGVIGESGSGKSTLARVIAGLLPAAPATMRLDGVALAPTLEARGLEELRRIQIVFQAADTALNPAHSVERILSRPLASTPPVRAASSGPVRRFARPGEASDAFSTACRASFRAARSSASSCPRLAAEPALILCDEVTSSLDNRRWCRDPGTVASRRELGLALMFISHDPRDSGAVCDEVMILYAGQMMERGPGGVVMQAPQHPMPTCSPPRYRNSGPAGSTASMRRASPKPAARPRAPVPPIVAPSSRAVRCVPGRAKPSRRRCGASPRAPMCTAIARSRSFWPSNPRAAAPP